MAKITTDTTEAAALLRNSQLVAIPTETVYGLAGNGFDTKAILSIYEAKGRPRFNPLILHIGSTHQLSALVTEVPEVAWKLISKFWPGPLTVLLPKSDKVPELVTAGSHLVAIRMPSHPLALQLLKSLDFPLAAPSANPSGYVSPTQAIHVQEQLGDKIQLILDGGQCTGGIESTIIGFDNGQVTIYREGLISQEEIRSTVLNDDIVRKSIEPSTAKLSSPGQLSSHYAPKKRMLMQHPAGYDAERIGLLRFSKPLSGIPARNQIVLSPNGSLKEAAANLFAALRQLDTMDVDVLFGEFVPDIGIGRAINDRLRRASFRTGVN